MSGLAPDAIAEIRLAMQTIYSQITSSVRREIAHWAGENMKGGKWLGPSVTLAQPSNVAGPLVPAVGVVQPDGVSIGETAAGEIFAFPTWFNVKRYGAKGNGTTDDTTAIAAAITALDAAGGGILYFPTGTYKTTGGFTLNTPFVVLGDGAGGFDGVTGANSLVECTSATATLFTVTAYKGLFRDIGLANTAGGTPTAGAGISVQPPSVFVCVSYDSISVAGFYIDIDSQGGQGWSLRNCFLTAPVLYALKVQNLINADAGDWVVDDSVFYSSVRNSTAAIAIASSGGAKISNCKINQANDNKSFTYGIYLASSVSTSDVSITNVSIENVATVPVYVSITGGAIWSNFQISNLQLLSLSATDYAMVFSCSGATLANVVVMNCVCQEASGGSNPAAIHLVGVTGARISNILAPNFSAIVSQSGGTNVLDLCEAPANTVLAGPASGPGQVLSFRALVAGDLPGGGGGTVTAVSGTAPVSVSSPTTTPVISVAVAVASGASHATGLVPDPGGTAGTTKFLREDMTWQVPAGSGGGAVYEPLCDGSVPALIFAGGDVIMVEVS